MILYLCISILRLLLTYTRANHYCRISALKKRDWSSANTPLYLVTHGALLSSVRVPFHLLCTNTYPTIDNACTDLNCHYRGIISCIKQAEDVTVPLIHVRRNTQKQIWKCTPMLKKKVKSKAKFWLRIWSVWGRASRGTVFDLKQKTKLEYKHHLRAVRYSGENFPKNNSE